MEAVQGTNFRRIAIAVALAVLTTLVITNLSGSGQEVTATHAPANKVVASGRTIQHFGPGGAQEIMSATLRTSKPTDLIMSVSLECAILTKLLTAGGPEADYTSATVSAQINVWIEENGRVVPISSISSPPQDPATAGNKETDSVTFCQREEGRGVTDVEEEDDGIDKMQTYQQEKAANAFNWVLLNAGSGIHTFKVMAEIVDTDATNATCESGLAEGTCSQAWIGNRTFVIEPTKLANDATVT